MWVIVDPLTWVLWMIERRHIYPFIRTEYQFFLICGTIISIILSTNSKLLNTLTRNFLDSLSYVFVISNFTTTLFILFLPLISLIISCVTNTFSVILIPFTKPYWGKEIILGSTINIFSCNNLKMILLVNVLRLIGLKSTKILTSSFLGMSTRLVWVTYLGNSCP